MTDSQLAIATRKVKWDRAYQQRYGITTGLAAEIDPALLQKIDRLSCRIYRALHLSGYARIDFRMRADGTVYALEANANPNLTREEDFSEAARAAGLGYKELLERIMQLGCQYRVEWRDYGV
jgi:D-alanine-D-alanine ligase